MTFFYILHKISSVTFKGGNTLDHKASWGVPNLHLHAILYIALPKIAHMSVPWYWFTFSMHIGICSHSGRTTNLCVYTVHAAWRTIRPIHTGAPCMHYAACTQATNIFFENACPLRWDCKTGTALLLQLYMAYQTLPVFAQTQREYCAQFGHVFMFKFTFANCAPDFSI